MHPLTILAVGLYGEVLPNQNGAPIRLVVPWKYGFKSIKSIVKLRFVEQPPINTWQRQYPQAYGFYANVNPAVDHPNWSQAREARLPSLFRTTRTLPFNGYADQVQQLYAGMDLREELLTSCDCDRRLTSHGPIDNDRARMAHAEYNPQLATLGSEPPSGDRWLHEIKYDGYRIGCVIDKKGARLISRNGKDWTHVFPTIAEAAQTLKTRDAIIDGEVAMVMPDGRTSFAALQQAAAGTASHAPLVYFVFDLLRLDGERLDRLPLEERKARLRTLVEPASPKKKAGLAAPKPKAKAGRIRYAEHIVGEGETLFEHATKIGLEGIISKRRDLPYEPGRSDSWRKSKVSPTRSVRDRRHHRS